MTTTARRYDDYLRGPAKGEGMGGYLDPPEYPTHLYSVGSGRRSNPHSLSSLPSIVRGDAEYVNPKIRAQAKALLDAWHANPPAITRSDVQAWIADCYRHWASCWYSEVPDDYGCHTASAHSKHPPRSADALDYALYHIRTFYPTYTPEVR